MKNLYIILVFYCFISCQKEVQKKTEEKEKLEPITEVKLNVGLPKSYTDTLSILSFLSSDRKDFDKKYLKIDYKRKLDSLYDVIDEELNIIDCQGQLKEDVKSAFNQLKQSYVIDEKASYDMWNASYGENYREYRTDENAFKRIKQMIYKRRYEELLIFNFHLRSNITRWREPHDFYRKTIETVYPRKILDSIYPKKIE